MRRSLSTAFVLFTCYCYSQTPKESVRVTDMLKIKSITGINLSKDGRHAVFTVTAIEPEGDSKWDYKYVNQVWMVNTDGNSAPRQLTTKEGSSQAAWSPDGKQIAYVEENNGQQSLWLRQTASTASSIRAYRCGEFDTPDQLPSGGD